MLKPANALTGFNTQNPNGTWTLSIENIDAVGLSLNRWILDFYGMEASIDNTRQDKTTPKTDDTLREKNTWVAWRCGGG